MTFIKEPLKAYGANPVTAREKSFLIDQDSFAESQAAQRCLLTLTLADTVR
jgi:hypothetical protein